VAWDRAWVAADVAVNLRVGLARTGLFDLREEVGNLHFKVFFGQDVLADGPGVFRDPVAADGCLHPCRWPKQKTRVRPSFSFFCTLATIWSSSVVPMVGPAIRKEDDDEGAVLPAGPQRQRFAQSIVNRGCLRWA